MDQDIAPEALAHFSDETKTCLRRLTEFFIASKAQQESHELYLRSEPMSRLAAVLVLLFEHKGQLRVVLTTRAKQLRTHGGQTSLPGGKMEDTDDDIITTAFREANEEVSLPLNCQHIHILGRLELQPFHKLIVAPVVALLTDNSVLEELQAGKDEVEHIFSHPLEAILDPNLAARLEDLVPHGSTHWSYESKHHHYQDYAVQALGNTTYRWHFFQSSASPITGMTADILIQAAQIAYDREPQYERFASNQLQTYEETVEAYKKTQILLQMRERLST